MELLDIILAVVVPCAMAYFGYNERDKTMIKQKLEKTKEDMNQINTQQQILKTQNQDLKDDLHRIEKKVDQLLDKLINKSL